MCGFVGTLQPPSSEQKALEAEVGRWADTLTHRGPDDRGTWADPSVAYAVGFRRLAIVDLGPTGHQPMVSRDGRWVLTFNGEIYDHLDLRAEIESGGLHFRGTSDTEAVVEAIATWGVDRTVTRLDGMFAIAAWDRWTRRLHLARDPFGEKPLYVARHGRRLVFGSEVKALLAAGAPTRLRRELIGEYLRWGFVPGNDTLIEGITSVPPGTLVVFDEHGREVRRRRYFDPGTLAGGPRSTATRDELCDELDSLLARSVTRRLEADVTVGAFLSGGVDSSLVCALAQAHGAGTLRTFAVGFDAAGYDESPHAEAVARHLGTDHTTLRLHPEDALAVVPRLPAMFDLPMGDPSAIATFAVASLAREHVTVALSGDAGDELFGGYDRYRWAAAMWARLGRVPRSMRGLGGSLLRAAPTSLSVALARRVGLTADQIRRVGDLAGAPDPLALYDGLLALHPTPGALLAPELRAAAHRASRTREAEGRDLSPLDRFQLSDQQRYLPDDILVKVDRTSMAVGLESRIPLLDPAIVKFAWKLPVEERVAGDTGKVLLRELLHRHVPRDLVDRPKAGFALPVDRWLRGPLRDWGEELLSPRRLEHDGLLDPVSVRALWDEHQTGTRNRQFVLWSVLMLQSWVDQRESPRATAGAGPRHETS